MGRRRLTLAADPRLLRAASLFVKEMAAAVGLPDKAVSNLELATEEAGLLIIDQSFPGQTSGTFDIVCEYQDGRFIAAFEDKGAPFEWGKAAQSETSRHSVAPLSGFADELRMVNRGKEGKRPARSGPGPDMLFHGKAPGWSLYWITPVASAWASLVY